MDRQRPRTTSDEIDLYIRTYYSLLRSSGEVRVRAFEEAHSFSDSSLHAGARGHPRRRRLRLQRRPPARRACRRSSASSSASRTRASRPSASPSAPGRASRPAAVADRCASTAATCSAPSSRAPATSTTSSRSSPPTRSCGTRCTCSCTTPSSAAACSPPPTTSPGRRPHASSAPLSASTTRACAPSAPPSTPTGSAASGRSAAAPATSRCACSAAPTRSTSAPRSAGGRASSRPTCATQEPRRPPIYFVSSNTHSLVNMLGGYARAHRDEIVEYARRSDPEGLAEPLQRAIAGGHEHAISNITYYLLRAFLHEHSAQTDTRLAEIHAYEAESRHHLDRRPRQDRRQRPDLRALAADPRAPRPAPRMPGLERLRQSDALVINIDYPLGMAAYHHLSRIGQGSGEVRGHLHHGQGRHPQRPRRRRHDPHRRPGRALAQHLPPAQLLRRRRRPALPRTSPPSSTSRRPSPSAAPSCRTAST
jgi:hypothetical protein